MYAEEKPTDRQIDKGVEQLATSGNSIFPASLCLSSWPQSGLKLLFFFSGFSPATCALTHLAKSKSPGCNDSASAFH